MICKIIAVWLLVNVLILLALVVFYKVGSYKCNKQMEKHD